MTTAITISTAALVALSAGSAFAHVSFTNAPVKVGAYVAATLQVPHGCDGKVTTELDVKLPEGFIAAKPMVKPGWEIEIVTGDYQKSYDSHGKAVTSGPVEIRFKNGSLPDDFYDTFTIYGQVAAGTGGLAFPTVQICGADARVAWDQVAPEGTDPHALKSPAPVLKLAADDTMDHDHAGHDMGEMQHDMGAMQMEAMPMDHGAEAEKAEAGSTDGTATIGDLTITGAYVRAMLPGQPVGGGFLTIANAGATDDRLVSVASPDAGMVETHDMAMNNGVMTMRKLKDGIAVAAGETVSLSPGGMHLMFMQVKTPFREGGSVAVTLTFEKAGAVTLDLPIVSARGKN
ncbi:DUF1775 domain-containing protein [Rhizobium halophytocola]|uniref:Uncharacterized protein YcnI/copper(I)-binding protein n=1 Tax=Rhizobium halophytocola TaxID=735519 RepID=A0ABS4DZH1_9HYPH|nr:DUF1775 domain-containing protein [Rhizobium halophytocola]MBP1851090.1 uncharacterized protein YcnI/copper(I)-binding protein [Rhizobium halophytocola]